MATRTDFSAEQWQALRNAPQLVALAAAGNSGLFGSLSEGMAMASTMVEALRGDQPLLKDSSPRTKCARSRTRSMARSRP